MSEDWKQAPVWLKVCALPILCPLIVVMVVLVFPMAICDILLDGRLFDGGEEEPKAPPKEELQPKHKVIKPNRGEQYWTPRELAEKLGCSKSYIYKKINEDAIEPIRQGRLWKIPPEEVMRVLEEGLK